MRRFFIYLGVVGVIAYLLLPEVEVTHLPVPPEEICILNFSSCDITFHFMNSALGTELNDLDIPNGGKVRISGNFVQRDIDQHRIFKELGYQWNDAVSGKPLGTKKASDECLIYSTKRLPALVLVISKDGLEEFRAQDLRDLGKGEYRQIQLDGEKIDEPAKN